MTRHRHPDVPVSSYSRWLQVGGFLLAALLALVAPGSADHVDAVFDRHFHDPVTRSVVPLVDDHGHVHQATADEIGPHDGRIDASPGQTGFAPERAVPDAPAIPLPWIILLAFSFTAGPRLIGRLIGPAPPPPRA